MISAIHQPNFMPCLGFFDKIGKCNIFVVYDDAQFCRRDYHNQNYILLYGRPFKLKVPVVKAPLKTPLFRIKIDKNATINGVDWKNYHLLRIKEAYIKAPYFNEIFPILEEIYMKNFERLVDFNVNLINTFCDLLGIKRKIYFSRILSIEKDIKSKSTKKLVDLTKYLNCDVYFSGIGGKNYIQENLFRFEGIDLKYQAFEHPIYSQNSSKFVKNMSVMDFLFNIGPYDKK